MAVAMALAAMAVMAMAVALAVAMAVAMAMAMAMAAIQQYDIISHCSLAPWHVGYAKDLKVFLFSPMDLY